MKYLIAALMLVLAMPLNAKAENLNYMASGQEYWTVEEIEKTIEEAEQFPELKETRVSEMQKEIANKLSKVETAAGEDTPESSYGHFLGH